MTDRPRYRAEGRIHGRADTEVGARWLEDATSIFGGEGLFLTTLTGPGKVIVQTMTLSKLRRELGVMGKSGGGEASGLGALTNMFGSED